MVTNLILDAKAKGLKYVDLFGIAPEDEPDHEWAGFTKFKKSFGGESVTYPGTWDVPVNTAGYKVYDAAYRARPKAQQALTQTKKLRTFEETLETIKPPRKSFNGPPYHLGFGCLVPLWPCAKQPGLYRTHFYIPSDGCSQAESAA